MGTNRYKGGAPKDLLQAIGETVNCRSAARLVRFAPSMVRSGCFGFPKFPNGLSTSTSRPQTQPHGDGSARCNQLISFVSQSVVKQSNNQSNFRLPVPPDQGQSIIGVICE
jgi:hypothetical protein